MPSGQGDSPPRRSPETADLANRKRRFLTALVALGCVLLVVALSASAWILGQLRGSLPRLEGQLTLSGLAHCVSVDRDSLGVPTVAGENRRDVSRALGFLHAQERFFQMDLMRRRAAGTLAELLGPGLLSADRYHRVHRFGHRAAQIVARLPEAEKMLAQAYAEGVNAGLDQLEAPPFEYLLLRTEPEPWRPEDTILVAFSMYLQLNDDRGVYESARALVFDLLGPEMFEFLYPIGTEWDAPVAGDSYRTAPVPGPEILNLRARHPIEIADLDATSETDSSPLGSNNWAVSGRLSAHGGAIVANDMHLSLSVPNIWYRASLEYLEPTSQTAPRKVTGVSLPGTPFIIAGSNGQVAWGHTNTWGDWDDLVLLEPVAGDPDSYQTPEGPRQLQRFQETLKASNGETETLEVLETVWGPVIDKDHLGRSRALRWIAHEPYAVSFALLEVERSNTIGSALEAANSVGAPPQNFVAADTAGAIGWTVMGPIPRRFGFDGRLPSSWADGSKGWDGVLETDEYPRIQGSDVDRIWTANSRVIGGESMSLIGSGVYRLGSRAQQIRENLLRRDHFDEAEMLEIQLDDRARFLDRWQRLFLATLQGSRESSFDSGLLVALENWGAHASSDSVGYRAVREFRRQVAVLVLGSVTSECKAADPRFEYQQILQYEGPLWRLVSERPIHFLDRAFDSWDELLEAAASRVSDLLTAGGAKMNDSTWGRYNSVTIRHPLSPALPGLSGWLDMPTAELPGDSHMPRFQSTEAGASERMVVSPGHEQEGIFHMPTGQSGHPLSPHYRDGQEAWAEGRPTPFLPGPPKYTMLLLPD